MHCDPHSLKLGSSKPPKAVVLPTYDHLTTLSIDEVFLAIAEERVFTYGGKECSPLKHRVMTYYVHGITCECGAKGEFFAVERFTYDKGKLNTNTKYHLNFYAIVDGKEVMMTADHILTRAEGGKDHVDNFKPMCEPCNQLKGGVTTENDFAILEARKLK
jgi:hypothetical protein